MQLIAFGFLTVFYGELNKVHNADDNQNYIKDACNMCAFCYVYSFYFNAVTVYK